jgi:hypothetical protein
MPRCSAISTCCRGEPVPVRRNGRRVSAIIYDKPVTAPSLLTSGIGRADAMAYRDELGEAMTDTDWSEVECRLRRAYASLKAAVAGDEP